MAGASSTLLSNSSFISDTKLALPKVSSRCHLGTLGGQYNRPRPPSPHHPVFTACTTPSKAVSEGPTLLKSSWHLKLPQLRPLGSWSGQACTISSFSTQCTSSSHSAWRTMSATGANQLPAGGQENLGPMPSPLCVFGH